MTEMKKGIEKGVVGETRGCGGNGGTERDLLHQAEIKLC